jgi:hypothetical protein
MILSYCISPSPSPSPSHHVQHQTSKPSSPHPTSLTPITVAWCAKGSATTIYRAPGRLICTRALFQRHGHYSIHVIFAEGDTNTLTTVYSRDFHLTQDQFTQHISALSSHQVSWHEELTLPPNITSTLIGLLRQLMPGRVYPIQEQQWMKSIGKSGATSTMPINSNTSSTRAPTRWQSSKFAPAAIPHWGRLCLRQ